MVFVLCRVEGNGRKSLTKKGYVFAHHIPIYKYMQWKQGNEQKVASDAGAVEEVRIELSLSHVASVFLDKFLNSVLPPHVRWLVGVCLKPFPPAEQDRGLKVCFLKSVQSLRYLISPAHIESRLTDKGSKCPPADNHAIHQGCGQVHLANMTCQLDPDKPTGKGLEEDDQADCVDPRHQGGKWDQVSVFKTLQPNENNLLLLSSTRGTSSSGLS